MKVGIWCKKADYISDCMENINRWIASNEQINYRVVDKQIVMAPEVTGGSSSRQPWVTITVWMDDKS